MGGMTGTEWLGHHTKGPRQTEESHEVQKGKRQSSAYAEEQPHHTEVVKQLGREELWGAGGQRAQHEQCPLAVKRANSILSCINSSAASGHGGWSFLSMLLRPHLGCCFQFPSMRGT